jgi:hypothetical protein
MDRYDGRPASLANSAPICTCELAEHVLKAIQLYGRYHEVTINPADGRVIDALHIEGWYDSYSQVYELNGTRWKIVSHTSLQGGQSFCGLLRVNED